MWLWYSIIAATLLLFIILHSVVLPRRFLRCRYDTQISDRGIQNINEEGGHTVVYAPAVPYRKYLKNYLLSRRDKGLQLVFDFDKEVRYAEMEIALFDGYGEVFKVLQVRQAVDGGEAEAMTLPEETAYVSVTLVNVDGNKFQDKRKKRIAKGRFKSFFIFTSVVEIVAIFLLKFCVAKLFGGIFMQSFVESWTGNLITLGLAGAMILINNLLTLIEIKRLAARD